MNARQVAFGFVLCVSLVLALAPGEGGAIQAGDEGASYTDPDFGWSISWDPDVWAYYGSSGTALNEGGETGIEIILGGVQSQELGAVFIGSHIVFGGDLEACVETLFIEVGMSTGISVSDAQEADLELPEAPDGAEQSLSSALLSGGGIELEGLVYIECRPLVEDEAVLGIRWVLPEADFYEDMLPAFEELTSGLVLPGDGGQAAGADDEDNGDDGDDRATGEASGDGEAEAEAEDASGSYTDPTYGWSITWDPAVWEGQEPGVTLGEDDKEGHQLDLYGEDLALGGVTVASLPSPTLANDLAACVDFVRPRTLEELEGDGAYVDNLRELGAKLPEAPAGAVRTLYAWDAGGGERQVGYYECRTLVEGEAVLLITWVLPVGGDYTSQVPAFEELIAGLDLIEAQPE